MTKSVVASINCEEKFASHYLRHYSVSTLAMKTGLK